MAEEVSDEELLSRLRSEDPLDCENIIGNLWSAMGYSVDVKKGSGDRGIDIEATKSDPIERTQLIQVKKYSKENKIGSQKIREYRTLYDQRPDADRVVLVTTGYFTSNASELAADLNVDIIDGIELIQLIRSQAPDILKKLSEGPQKTGNNSPEENQESEDESPEETPEQVNNNEMSEDSGIGVLERQRLKVKLTELREKRGEMNNPREKENISQKIEDIESKLRNSSS